MKKHLFLCMAAGLAASVAAGAPPPDAAPVSALAANFANPPLDARAGVYWYFMDGNYSREGVTRDVEAMRAAGIGYAVFLEVNVGVPRGKTDLMSDEWIAMFRHIVDECERCDIQIILGVGPGWTGSGGPWVEGAQSMRHLVAWSCEVQGGGRVEKKLEKPRPRNPFFGLYQFPPALRAKWEAYCRDVCVLAFPSGDDKPARVKGNADEKAHVYRAPYSSQRGVRPVMDAPVRADGAGKLRSGFDSSKAIDISANMRADGTLVWDAPPGKWTVMRFCARNNGAITRPAPAPGVGFECDKFSEKALREHLKNFTDRLFAALGPRRKNAFGGIKYLHLDSWEMGAQNWSDAFCEEFTRRRGYDPKPFYPAMCGFIVDGEEKTERFLWDLRRTSQELIIENHVNAVKRYAREHGCIVSCEPYDMNPAADLELAAAADVPMAEFWAEGFGFNASYAVWEAASAAHVIGCPVVPAESFTAHKDAWRPHPASMKNQNDWALAAGINRLVFHTWQHQCLPENLKPGMTMGPYGVHWDRNQTWWPMAAGYHSYLARCQYMLQRGRTVSDILYLAPENAPHVFRPPESALDRPRPVLPDRKGYGFDGCPPSMLFKASVAADGSIVFPGGAKYRLLVLPEYDTMTPELLRKIRDLVQAGATAAGVPPLAAPGLSGYPACDAGIKEIAASLWGTAGEKIHRCGKGRMVRMNGPDNLYPRYADTAAILAENGVVPDFEANAVNGKTAGSGGSQSPVRFAHRTCEDGEIYFVANRTADKTTVRCTFRVDGLVPEVWDPIDGKRYSVEYSREGGRTAVVLDFEPYQSLFAVFRKPGTQTAALPRRPSRFEPVATVEGPWDVEFRPPVGNKFHAVFPSLGDWTLNGNPAIKYFSGIASYETEFDLPGEIPEHAFISLGDVKVMAHVWLNGRDLGIVWTAPWRVDAAGALKKRGNKLRIDMANLWTNRLVGDESLPYDGPAKGRWPEWLEKGKPRPSQRVTFASWRHYNAKSPLEKSGLLGPVGVENGK